MAKYTRILSIDGGGIRGVIPGQVLVALEDKLQKASGKRNARIADFFDLIAGTSTGGILACAYLSPKSNRSKRPKFTASEVVGLYFNRGGEIFGKKKLWSIGGIRDEKYSEKNLEKALSDYFGKLKLSELLKPCLITAYDIKDRRGYFFTQHDARNRPANNFPVREVARATSAAPTYFECARIQSATRRHYPLIDGGVFVNNPTLCAYAEARKLFCKGRSKTKHVTAADMVILSLGTGTVKKSYRYKDAKDWGAIKWIKPLIDIMMSGVSETVDYQLRQIYDAVDKPEHYLRINKTIREGTDCNSAMDDASLENLGALKDFGTGLAEDYDEQLDRLVEMLLK